MDLDVIHVLEQNCVHNRLPSLVGVTTLEGIINQMKVEIEELILHVVPLVFLRLWWCRLCRVVGWWIVLVI